MSHRNASIRVRLFQAEDALPIAQLFHDTVREINSQDYSQEQVEAWAPDNLFFRNWQDICANCLTYIAEEEGQILGFGELEAVGKIGCFYCHKDQQGRGVGRLLYHAIEAQAKRLGLTSLTVASSITAKPFFEKMGFEVIRQQQVHCRGQLFTNYLMQKSLE